MAKPTTLHLKKLAKSLKSWLPRYWRSSLWHRVLVVVIAILTILVIIMYGVAQWYIASVSNTPFQMGVSFIPDYAQSLGVNPEANMDALIKIGIKQFRLVSYWSDGEPAPGQYDFSQLDWEFSKAQAAHAKITLTLGLRQPRWPECHAPSWVNTTANDSTWQPQLQSYMTKVVKRYQHSPSLQSYQLENEYFLKGFGQCTNFDRNRLVSEYNLIKQLDPTHPIIISRSNNSIGWPSGQPQGDAYGISVYKRVWDAALTHRYFEYPYPAWYYAFVAGVQKIFTGKDMVIDEMQAEAWAPNNKSVQAISLSEQNKSLDAGRLKDRFSYAKATGIRQIEMWGAEYWYYRQEVLHDPSLMNVAQQEFSSSQR